MNIQQKTHIKKLLEYDKTHSQKKRKGEANIFTAKTRKQLERLFNGMYIPPSEATYVIRKLSV